MLTVKNTNQKGEGVFAAKSFRKDEIVLIGEIEKEMKVNDTHTTQMGPNKYVLFSKVNRTVNHSCAPNCGVKINPVTGTLDFVAFRDIAEGEEIVYDYAMRNYSVENFPSQCRCNAPNCRGQINGWKGLSMAKKMEYINHVSPYILELDHTLLELV